MKNLNIKISIFLPLIAASIFCTVYLNTQSVNVKGIDPTFQETEMVEAQDLEEEEQQKAPLLDVRLIKKVLDTGKKFIPSSID